MYKLINMFIASFLSYGASMLIRSSLIELGVTSIRIVALFEIVTVLVTFYYIYKWLNQLREL